MVQEQTGYADVQDTITDTVKQSVIENLRNVYDPEISINIYDLGLIYDINIESTLCTVTMSLTSAFCPAADMIIEDVRHAVLAVSAIEDVRVDVTFEPQWGPDMMSEDARLILGIF